MSRDSMVVYQSWLDAIHELPEAMQGELALAILEVGLEGQVVCKIGQTSKAMLALIKPMIEANNKRYANGCKGGRKPNDNQSETKAKPNDNQSETYNDICIMKNDKCIMGEDKTPTPAREKIPEGTFVPTTMLYAHMSADAEWLNRVSANTKTSVADLLKELSTFCVGVMLAEDSKEIHDARRHFIAWRRKRPSATAEAKPLYNLMTYAQMLADANKHGVGTDAYAPIRVAGKDKPMWVSKADKERLNIPDEL